jgi:predicted 2-oxoglutarate/Fe(II)-dependent dioxygenase YbiX
MLSSPGDFSGGSFMTMEADGRFKRHAFEKGDMLMFQSHKYHSVDTVKSGTR